MNGKICEGRMSQKVKSVRGFLKAEWRYERVWQEVDSEGSEGAGEDGDSVRGVGRQAGLFTLSYNRLTVIMVAESRSSQEFTQNWNLPSFGTLA